MKKYENNPKEFLRSLSDEEFLKLLEDAGFEVEEGNGEFINLSERNFSFQEDGPSFSMNKKSNYKISNNNMKYPHDFKPAA